MLLPLIIRRAPPHVLVPGTDTWDDMVVTESMRRDLSDRRKMESGLVELISK